MKRKDFKRKVAAGSSLPKRAAKWALKCHECGKEFKDERELDKHWH